MHPFVAALAARAPRPLTWAYRWRRAAVAVVLRPDAADPAALSLLVVRRATRAGDPWSGNVALPGGKAHPDDAGATPLELAATIARRETQEEVGVLLGEPVAVLSDHLAFDPRTARPMALTPVVFTVAPDTPAEPDGVEIVAAAWLPLAALAAPSARAVRWRRATPDRPGEARASARPPSWLALRWPERRVGEWDVWGLTLRVVEDLLRVGGAGGADHPARGGLAPGGPATG